jgi:general secretion pathway protein I
MKRDSIDRRGVVSGRPCVAERLPFRRSRKRLRYETNARAFTLVEVLVALVIFAMAAVVLGSSYVNVLTSYEVVARGTRTNADLGFAREQVLREPDRKKLEQGGEFETLGGGRAKWSVEITSTNVPEVFNVAFTYEAASATGTDAVKQTQQFTVLRPTWVDDVAERDKLKADMKERIYELQGKKPR